MSSSSACCAASALQARALAVVGDARARGRERALELDTVGLVGGAQRVGGRARSVALRRRHITRLRELAAPVLSVRMGAGVASQMISCTVRMRTAEGAAAAVAKFHGFRYGQSKRNRWGRRVSKMAAQRGDLQFQ